MKYRKSIVKFFVAFSLVCLVFIALYSGTGVQGTGRTHFEIKFIITDQATDAVIPNATVEFDFQNGPADEQPKYYPLTTDENGEVSHIRPHATAHFEGNIFHSGFWPYLPFSTYRAKAPGYKETQWFSLHSQENNNRIQELGMRQHLLVIPIALHRE